MSEIQEPECEKMETSVLLDAREIGEDDIEKLKGDTIGDTVYSSKWIINILLSIPKIFEDGWNENAEYDLCTLWDMTTEKDVVNFLIDNEFLKIAEFALNSTEDIRLTELMLGIINNTTCEPSVLDILGEREEFLGTIFRFFSSDEPGVLIQIFRLLSSAIWNIRNNPESRWADHLKNSTLLREVVPFVLKSSTSVDLLMAMTNFLRCSAEIVVSSAKTLLDELFESSSILSGMLESFDEVFSDNEAPFSSSTLKYIEDWLKLFLIIRKAHKVSQEILQEDNLNRTIEILRRILKSFADPWNLYPVDETKAFCVHRCAELIFDFRSKGILKKDFTVWADAEVLNLILTIDAAMKEDKECIEIMDVIQKYLVGYWIELSKVSSVEEIVDILRRTEQSVVYHSVNILRSNIAKEKVNSIIRGMRKK